MSQFLKNCRTVLTLPDADTGPHRLSPGRASCTPTEDSAAGKVHVQKRQWFPPFHPRHRTHRPARTCTGRQRTSLQPQGKDDTCRARALTIVAKSANSDTWKAARFVH